MVECSAGSQANSPKTGRSAVLFYEPEVFYRDDAILTSNGTAGALDYASYALLPTLRRNQLASATTCSHLLTALLLNCTASSYKLQFHCAHCTDSNLVKLSPALQPHPATHSVPAEGSTAVRRHLLPRALHTSAVLSS